MNDQNMRSNRWQLPFGFFAGPILWGLQILVGYGLVSVACTSGAKWSVYLTVGTAGLIVLLAGILAYQAWDAHAGDGSILMDADQAKGSSTFWAVSSLAVSTLFFLLILTTAIAAIFLSPCPIITMFMP